MLEHIWFDDAIIEFDLTLTERMLWYARSRYGRCFVDQVPTFEEITLQEMNMKKLKIMFPFL